MARLQNIQKAGDYEYRVVLDSDSDANYVERARGAYYDEQLCEHRCLKCMNVVYWLHWNSNDTRAKATCSCGEKQTLEYLVSFGKAAAQLI